MALAPDSLLCLFLRRSSGDPQFVHQQQGIPETGAFGDLPGHSHRGTANPFVLPPRNRPFRGGDPCPGHHPGNLLERAAGKSSPGSLLFRREGTGAPLPELPLYNVPAEFFNYLSNQLPVFMIKPFFGQFLLGMYSFSHRYLNIPVQLTSISIGSVYIQKARSLHREAPANWQQLPGPSLKSRCGRPSFPLQSLHSGEKKSSDFSLEPTGNFQVPWPGSWRHGFSWFS